MAQLNSPNGLALDQAGNLYIADLQNSVIRRVSRDGVISRYAGSAPDFGGDGGPALKAQLLHPQDVAVDRMGNLIIADSGNRRIRKVTASGIITTIGGTGGSGSTGDGGPAIAATLFGPLALALDVAGNLFVADGTRVRRIDPQGIITTIAGTSSRGFSGDGGAATAAQITEVRALAIDPAGNLLMADRGNRRIRKVAPDGLISTVAGNGEFTASGDGGPAVSAGLAGASGIAVDAGGTLFIADVSRIRRVSAGLISPFAGDGTYNFSGDGGPATSAQVGGASGIALDANGNLYFGDSGNFRIRKVSPDGVIRTIAGNGTVGGAGDGGPATSAQIAVTPFTGMAVDKDGNVYFGDFLNGSIRKISSGGVINRFVGTGTPTPVGSATAIATDPSGNVYYINNIFNRIGKVTPAGVATTLATDQTLVGTQGLAVDAAGNLYVSEYAAARIRKVTPDGIVTIYAGTGVSGFSGDGGPATKAQLESPGPLAIDSAGTLYVSDNRGVRTISPAGIISTMFFNSSDYSGDGGPVTTAGLGGAVGLAVDAAGNVYVGDNMFGAVRRFRPGVVTGAPAIAAITNAASNLKSPIAPGQIVVLYGSELGPAQLTGLRLDATGSVATELAGTQVTVNGIAAPLIYTSATQVSAVIPYGAFNPAHIAVSYLGGTSAALLWFVDQASPALFTANSSGVGQAAAINQSGSYNSPTTPAAIGSVIQLYATGEGATTPEGLDGKPAVTPFPVPVLPVTVSIGGKSAKVLYAGGAPGVTAGLIQINVEIPSAATTGSAVPVLLRVGDRESQSGVVIAVSEK